jgi:hypothetical protein
MRGIRCTNSLLVSRASELETALQALRVRDALVLGNENSEIKRAPPGVDAADGDRTGGEQTLYERYPGLTRDDSEMERDREDGRPR